jgi:threonine dehydratase
MTGVDTAGGREPGMTAQELIGAADLEAARAAVAGLAVRTPTLASPDLSEQLAGAVWLKAECLQSTGSFKFRGALSRVAALGRAAERGLVTASAGNHARAVAQAARLRGVGCEVFMPRDATVSKVLAAEALGARVRLEGASVDDTFEQALRLAEESGAEFVHPFDDIDVIAGQATIGLELIEDVPDLARVVVPVGGGGLASGIGIALRRAGRDVRLVGVQAAACAPYVDALAGRPVERAAAMTIADGVAIKHPGRLTLPLLRELLDEMLTVEEDQIADAMVFLAERAKLVAEGAGAIAVAALMSGALPPVDGTTVAIVSGGNVDSGLLASLLLRHESEEGRRVRIFTRVPDRPGGLAELLGLIAAARANVVSVEHVREAVPLHVRETGVELTLETRGPGHTEEVLGVLAAGGYEARIG